MASKTLRSPLIRHVASRGYAQATPVRKEAHVLTNVVSKNIFAAAIDNGSPVTRVTVAFKAGSRYEHMTELGLSHMLRSSAGLSTKNISGFLFARQLAQIGATFSATGDREFIYYTVEATQDNVDDALEYLGKIISNQEFRPWELTDNAPRLKYDISAIPPQVRAIDLLHKAAYRRSLGNSLYISPKRIGSISSESLQHYANSHMTTSNCAITVLGSLEKANIISKALNLGDGGAKPDAATYHGGDMRKEMGGDLAHVALAVPGCAVNTPQSLALAIAAKALGNGPVIKWGSDNSVLAKAVGNIGPFAAAGFNVSYSDSGLFGVILTVPKDEAKKATKAVAKVLKDGDLSSSVISAAKKQLKLQVLTEAEYGTTLTESMAAQALYNKTVKTSVEIADLIEKVSEADVAQALSNAVKGKMSMGAAGNLAFVPYVDELAN